MSRRSTERLFFRTTRRQRTWPPPPPDQSLFREADPVPALAEQVAKIRWGHEWIAPEAPVEERIVPDGAVHLLFVIPEAGAGRPYGLALGATSEPTVVRLAGRIEHVEVELLPGAVPALLGVPAGELSRRVVSLEDLWGDRAAVLRDRLAGTSDPAERLRIVQRTLAGGLRAGGNEWPPRPSPPLLGEALRRMRAAVGNLRVRELADDLGISERRVEQLFHTHVGLSPKVTSRLLRLRGSLERLDSASPASWVQIALDCGYSDQSHLVNEFRALTGLSPGELRRRAGYGGELPDRT